MKPRWQFAVGVTAAAVLCLVSAWVVFKRFTVTAIVPSTLDSLSTPIGAPTPAAKGQPMPAPSSTNLPTVTPSKPEVPQSVGKQPAGAPATRQGVFRIGNPTGYPVRVALLSKKTSSESALPGGNTSTVKAVSQANYELPSHWDFAPEEGGARGLLVSLPDRTLKLKKGDVLVAFAQDGSGRYWGPYVVDETALPLWNAKAVEWQLILQP
ncbi:MAG: hypothetical protein KME42_02575 [Tildeniella nuda ZEHNDER 1965/U140]|nr:hypothetical protein [Tildeniella nuda ZEHNDER 1965/U140]